MTDVNYTPVQTESQRSLHDPEKKYHRAHQVIKALALEFCQSLFSDAENVGEDLVWSPDADKSKIRIVDKYQFNFDQVQSRPAIVANRGPQIFTKSSGFRQHQETNMRTGSRTHIDLVKGSVTLSCFAREGLEAEDIAGIVFEALQSFRDVLRKLHHQGRIAPQHHGFFRIEAAQMGEEALVKSDSRPDLSVVPVALSAMVQRRWLVRPKARKLRDITVKTNAAGVAPGVKVNLNQDT